MRRVAMFREDFLPYSQTFVFEELRLLERHQVDVFAWRRLNRALFPYEPVHVGGVPFLLTGRSAAFDAEFRMRGYGLVHAHFGTSGMYALPWATRYRLPLVVTFHGVDVTVLDSWARLLPHRWPYAWLASSVLQRMTLGLCVSTEIRDRLLAKGASPERLIVHRLGIDLGSFTKGPRDAARVEAIMVGRLVEKKGFEYGLRAFALASRRASNAFLTIVGGGPRRAALERLARTLGVAERVVFAGVLPGHEVAERLSRSDVLLAPSVTARDGNREGSPMVVKEASASQVVPIGTYHGGIPEAIDDGDTGFLVPERDVETLADRLERLAVDPALRARMGAAARRKMEREYDNRTRVRALEERYDEAVLRFRAETTSS
jgi:colanic acid/amylovoran/stewartan biosynthesis glycosyltransferase WcaL/AmsK/CpsK